MTRICQLAIITLLSASCASAQTPEIPAPTCEGVDGIVKMLQDDYGETIVGRGLSGDGTLVVLFASEETWTIAKVTPRNCIVLLDAGVSWEVTKQNSF